MLPSLPPPPPPPWVVWSKDGVPAPDPSGNPAVAQGLPFQPVTRTPPVLVSFSPASGRPGDEVTVRGSGFSSAIRVIIGGAPASFRVDPGGLALRARVPQAAAQGPAPVRVVNPDGETDSIGTFQVLAQPAAAAPAGTPGPEGGPARPAPLEAKPGPSSAQPEPPAPAAAPAPASASPAPRPAVKPPALFGIAPERGRILEETTLLGYNLQDATQVTIAGTPVPFRIQDAGRIRILIPPGARAGKVTVTTPAGRAESPRELRLEPALADSLAFRMFVPDQASPGAWVSLCATKAGWCRSATLGGEPLPFRVAGNNRILVRVPEHSSGGPVTLTFDWGGTVQTPPLELAAQAPAPLAVASAAWEDGDPARLVVRGAGFGSVLRATLGETELSFYLLRDDLLEAWAPKAPMTAPATLRLEAPGARCEHPDVPALGLPPVVRYAPAGARVLDEVRVSGRNLRGATRVTVGGVPARFRVLDDTSILVLVPPGARPGRVAVATPGGTGESAAPMAVDAGAPVLPAFRALVPGRAPAGAWISVVGDKVGWCRAVTFAGRPVAFQVADSDRILVQVPAGTSTDAFWLEFDRLEALETGLLNRSGSAPGPLAIRAVERDPEDSMVTVYGTSLGSVARASVGGVPARLSLENDLTALLHLPGGFQGSGPIRLESRDQACEAPVPAQGLLPVDGGTRPSPGEAPQGPALPAAGAPSIARMDPAAGGPGTRVLLEGPGLARALEVRIGQAQAPFRVDARGRVELVVPGKAEAGPIHVRTVDGAAESGPPFRVEPQAPPSPLLLEIPARTVQPLEPVALHGWDLDGVTGVTLGGVPAPFWIQSPESLFVLIPPRARTGRITLDTRSGKVQPARLLRVGDQAPPTEPFTFKAFLPARSAPDAWVCLLGDRVDWCEAVTFGGQPVPFRAADAGRVLVKAPAGARSGPFTLRFPGGGTLTTQPLDLSGAPPAPPSITRVTRLESRILRIEGVSLQTTVRVSLGGRALILGVPGATEINVAVPADVRGPGTVRLETMAGTVESAESFQWGAVPAAPPALEVKGDTHPALRLGTVYLTQATQRPDGSVPLVAGRDAFLRAFPVADRENRAQPRLRFRVMGRDRAPLLEGERPLDAPGVPLRADPDTLLGSWNIPIPGDYIRPGHRVECALAPGGGSGPAAWSQVPLQVEDALPPVRVTLFPILLQGRLGRVADSQRSLESWRQPAEAWLPSGGLDLKVGPVFASALEYPATSEELVRHLQDELSIKRLLDPPEPEGLRTYYGVFSQYSMPDRQTQGLGQVGDPGLLRTRVAVGWDAEEDYAGTFGHELGHTLGLEHPEPGTAGLPGSGYPHAGKSIGAPGFDVRQGKPIAPSQFYSFMSYKNLRWVSDFEWIAVIDFLKRDQAALALEHKAQEPARSAAGARELLVQGRIQDGRAVFRPSIRIRHDNAVAPGGGPYTLKGLDAGGNALFQAAFALQERPDAEGGPRDQFQFSVALAPGQEEKLARLQVLGPVEGKSPSGPGGPGKELGELRPRDAAHAGPALARRLSPGRVSLAWDDQAYALLAVQDPATGRTIAMAEKSPVELETDVPELALLASDGLHTVESTVRVQD